MNHETACMQLSSVYLCKLLGGDTQDLQLALSESATHPFQMLSTLDIMQKTILTFAFLTQEEPMSHKREDPMSHKHKTIHAISLQRWSRNQGGTEDQTADATRTKTKQSKIE